MATYLNYPFDSELFLNTWQESPDPVKSAFIESGALVHDALIESQIQKLGNTPYQLDKINIILDEGVSLPISILNQMRRDCIDLLSEERVKIKW